MRSPFQIPPNQRPGSSAVRGSARANGRSYGERWPLWEGDLGRQYPGPGPPTQTDASPVRHRSVPDLAVDRSQTRGHESECRRETAAPPTRPVGSSADHRGGVATDRSEGFFRSRRAPPAQAVWPAALSRSRGRGAGAVEGSRPEMLLASRPTLPQTNAIDPNQAIAASNAIEVLCGPLSRSFCGSWRQRLLDGVH
jgi:hypothetical protein